MRDETTVVPRERLWPVSSSSRRYSSIRAVSGSSRTSSQKEESRLGFPSSPPSCGRLSVVGSGYAGLQRTKHIINWQDTDKQNASRSSSGL